MNFKNNTDNLDQHFLVSEAVINKFIEISNLTKNDICLEIGPGKAILTKIIAPKVKNLQYYSTRLNEHWSRTRTCR